VIRVLVADDHPIVRKGLRQILDAIGDIEVAAEADNGQAVLDRAAQGGIDVVLLDLSMPGRDGLEVLQELRRLRPEIRVLMLSMHPEDQYAVRTLKAGAAGYLNKESAPEELIRAVRKVHEGRRYVSASLAETLAVEIQNPEARPLHETLSNREYQVLRRIASGMPLKEIAAGMHLSVKTVSTYRARILEKLYVRNNVELARYAADHRLVP
jgi:two-component system, NarL family, invasion response regulator UvrY